MKKHILKFREVDLKKFNDVVNGIKTIETRAGTETYQKIQEGDILVIRCGDNEIEKTVLKREHYDSVNAIFNSPHFGKIMPWAKTLEDAEKTYYSFPEYKEKIAKHGILAFYLEP